MQNFFGRAYQGKKVLVTGHTGFKGSWLSKWLHELGAEVSGLSISIPTSPSHFETLGLSTQMADFRADIRQDRAVSEIINQVKPDIVFHLAAQPIVSLSLSKPVDNFSANVMGTAHVLEAIRQCPSVKAAVIITSDKCYENVEWEFGYRENDRLGGKDPYSASKACSEIVFSSYFRSYFAERKNFEIATARAGNVIGGGDWALDRIVPDCMRAWGQGEKVTIRSPKSTRPWQHVLEPLSGYLWLGAKLFQQSCAGNSQQPLNGESFNFGPAPELSVTVEGLLQEIAKHWQGVQWDVDLSSSMARKESGLLRLNCDKALARLNWKPTLNFSETVRMTADWYKTFYADSSPARISELTLQQIRQYSDYATERGHSWTRN